MTVAIAILLGILAAWAFIGHVVNLEEPIGNERCVPLLIAAILALGFLGLLLK